MHRALILIVDSKVETRHWMWRLLSGSFGVLEAPDAASARRWIEERPDIDGLVIDDDLADERGADLVRDLVRDGNPITERTIVVASEWRRVMLAGLNVVERGDVGDLVGMLDRWFLPSETRAVARVAAAAAHSLAR